MSKKDELSILLFAQNIEYVLPDNKIENPKIIKGIENAFKNSCGIDISGHIWISNEKLHTILRTTKKDANYYVAQIDKKNRCPVGDITFIKGSEIIRLIDERIQQTGVVKTGKNLEFSYDLYRAIRDCSDVKIIRIEYTQSLDDLIKKLKKERIKEFNIKQDELTGDKLDIKTSEFSHIRSCSIYPQFSDNILNGHILNKETHAIISQEGINDEEGLFELCKKNEWNIDWYGKYKENFD